MSVAFTEDAVRERRKTVTRRKGWTFIQPGDRITLCRKVMGRRKGEPLVRITEVEIVDVRREKLAELLRPRNHAYAAEEMAREGFPGLSPLAFVTRYFIDAQKMSTLDDVTRIEWRYLDTEAVAS
jgi:hypothetical protein